MIVQGNPRQMGQTVWRHFCHQTLLLVMVKRERRLRPSPDERLCERLQSQTGRGTGRTCAATADHRTAWESVCVCVREGQNHAVRWCRVHSYATKLKTIIMVSTWTVHFLYTVWLEMDCLTGMEWPESGMIRIGSDQNMSCLIINQIKNYLFHFAHNHEVLFLA